MIEHIINSTIVGLISAVIVYIIWRKHSISIWAYIASFLPDLPVLIQTPFGVSVESLSNILILSHTAGILIFPVILLIADLLLIELHFLRHLRVFRRVLPGSWKTAIKIGHTIERFQRYNLIPRPARLKSVYLAGIISGIIHLLFNLAVWSL